MLLLKVLVSIFLMMFAMFGIFYSGAEHDERKPTTYIIRAMMLILFCFSLWTLFDYSDKIEEQKRMSKKIEIENKK